MIVIRESIDSSDWWVLLGLNLRNHFWMWFGICLSVLILWWIEHIFEILSLRVVSHVTHGSWVFDDFNSSCHTLVVRWESRGAHVMWAWTVMRNKLILVEGIYHVQSFSFFSLVCNHIHICTAVSSPIRCSGHRFLRIVRIMNEKKGTVGRGRLCACLPDVKCCNTLLVSKSWCGNGVVIQNWCCCCVMIFRRRPHWITLRFL